MQRILVLLYLCFIGCICSYGQYNNIFIVDCSRSMICPNADKTGDWKTEEPNIRWNPAKSALKDWLNSYEDNDLITILPFNDDVVDVIQCKKKDLNWNNIEDILDKSVVSHHGKTSICNAWKKAEKYFDSSKYNFFYIITDGMDDHTGPCNLVQLINSFCSKIPEGSHGYFINLAQAGFPDEIINALNDSPCISIAPAITSPFGRFLKGDVSVVTNNMKSGGRDAVSLEFDRKNKYPMSVSTNDPYFNVMVKNGAVDKGVLTLEIGLRNGIDLTELKKRLDSSSYTFSINLSSPAIKILDNGEIDVEVILKPITELVILPHETQIELGKTDWYDKFIIPMKLPDTLYHVIRPIFNEEAILQNSSASLCVMDLPEKTKLLINGKDYTNKSFTINSNDSVLLQFITSVPCTDHDINARLVINSTTNVERLIGTKTYDNPSDFKVGIFGEIEEVINPLKLALIIMLILLICLLIIRIAYNLCFRSTMIGRINKIDQNDNTLEGLADVSGFHIVYLTSGKGKRSNGIIDSLILGKRLYVHVPNLPETVKLTGKSDKTIVIHPNKKVKINGITPLYKIKYKGKTIVNISNNDNVNIIRIKYF